MSASPWLSGTRLCLCDTPYHLQQDSADMAGTVLISMNPQLSSGCCSYPDDYPSQELSLKLTDASGLEEAAVRQLSKQLHQAAAQYAADSEVCSFQLITHAQEFLQEHNCPPAEDLDTIAPPQSLWHEMLQRDVAASAAASREQASNTICPVQHTAGGPSSVFTIRPCHCLCSRSAAEFLDTCHGHRF
jgi:hypothetical protein